MPSSRDRPPRSCALRRRGIGIRSTDQRVVSGPNFEPRPAQVHAGIGRWSYDPRFPRPRQPYRCWNGPPSRLTSVCGEPREPPHPNVSPGGRGGSALRRSCAGPPRQRQGRSSLVGHSSGQDRPGIAPEAVLVGSTRHPRCLWGARHRGVRLEETLHGRVAGSDQLARAIGLYGSSAEVPAGIGCWSYDQRAASVFPTGARKGAGYGAASRCRAVRLDGLRRVRVGSGGLPNLATAEAAQA